MNYEQLIQIFIFNMKHFEKKKLKYTYTKEIHVLIWDRN